MSEILEMPSAGIKSLHYFAEDGSYGHAGGLTVVDTTEWEESDFDLVEQASDLNRPLAARAISDWIEAGRSDKKTEAFMESLGLELP